MIWSFHILKKMNDIPCLLREKQTKQKSQNTHKMLLDFLIKAFFSMVCGQSHSRKKKKKRSIFFPYTSILFLCLFVAPRMLIDGSICLKVSHVTKIELVHEINTASILVLGNTYFVGGNGFNFL